MLETNNLTKRYGSQTALDAVNIHIEQGDVYGLVGPNGAGKTTILSIISGLRRATSGSVELHAQKQDIAICPDVPEFEPWLTALEVMQLAANLVGKAKTKQQLEKLLDDAGLHDATNRRVGGFSRGMTQRLALAATLVGDPKFVVLDEPCSALDPSGRVEVLDLISHMSAQATIIFSTHILADVQRICNKVGVLGRGKLLYQGDLSAFLDENTKPIWNITLKGGMKKAQAALAKHSWIAEVREIASDKLQITGTSVGEVETQLVKALAAADARVVSIEPLDSDLEHAFLTLTGAGKGARS